MMQRSNTVTWPSPAKGTTVHPFVILSISLNDSREAVYNTCSSGDDLPCCLGGHVISAVVFCSSWLRVNRAGHGDYDMVRSSSGSSSLLRDFYFSPFCSRHYKETKTAGEILSVGTISDRSKKRYIHTNKHTHTHIHI